MAKMSQIEKNIRLAYLDEYPDGDFTEIANKISNSKLCLEDPRKSYLCTHTLGEIIFLIFCAILSNCISYRSMVTFGEYKLEWLRKYFPYKNGIPSHDTLRRVLNMVRPVLLMQLFQTLLNGFRKDGSPESPEYVALDGKSVNGFYKTEANRILHSVSAYAIKNGLSLAQVITHNDEGKEEGEIQATQKLIELLDCPNRIFTGDAGFCNRSLAENIVNRGGDYIFQLKKNQRKLYENSERSFSATQISDEFAESDQGHGREEKRVYQVLSVNGTIDEEYLFSGMKSIIHVISHRQLKDKEMTREDRYYISSLSASESPVLRECIRSHWHIENKLHYVLDVTFKEDASRTKNMVGAENLLLFRRAILSLLRQVKSKDTIPDLLIKAALSDEFRTDIISRLL